MLRFLGARLIGVPRTPTGYDLPALEALLVEHRPKAFFTQPRLQSPTNSVTPLAQLFRLLQLAEAHELTLVENDIYVDMDPEPRPSLASLDQLKRVVYVSSFSKTISPNIRVGYVVARPDPAGRTGATEDGLGPHLVADITERLAFGALTEGRWRKHLKSVRDRLADAHGRVAQRLANQGFELFHEPKAGMYLWARHPDLTDGAVLSQQAVADSIMLRGGAALSCRAAADRVAALQRGLQRRRPALPISGGADCGTCAGRGRLTPFAPPGGREGRLSYNQKLR